MYKTVKSEKLHKIATFQPCIVIAGIDIATIASAEDREKENLYV